MNPVFQNASSHVCEHVPEPTVKLVVVVVVVVVVLV